MAGAVDQRSLETFELASLYREVFVDNDPAELLAYLVRGAGIDRYAILVNRDEPDDER